MSTTKLRVSERSHFLGGISHQCAFVILCLGITTNDWYVRLYSSCHASWTMNCNVEDQWIVNLLNVLFQDVWLQLSFDNSMVEKVVVKKCHCVNILYLMQEMLKEYVYSHMEMCSLSCKATLSNLVTKENSNKCCILRVKGNEWGCPTYTHDFVSGSYVTLSESKYT